jgi:hypothetical protein
MGTCGIDHDRAECTAKALRRWWRKRGRECYGEAGKIRIMAYGGGGKGSLIRLGKAALQGMANKAGLVIYVCHFPLGNQQMEYD